MIQVITIETVQLKNWIMAYNRMPFISKSGSCICWNYVPADGINHDTVIGHTEEAKSLFNDTTTRRFKPSIWSQINVIWLMWPSLLSRHKFFNFLSVYDILNQHHCLDFKEYFIFSTAPTKSHALTISCKQSSLNCYRYSFFVNSVFFWNCIVVSFFNRNVFKSELYSYLCK